MPPIRVAFAAPLTLAGKAARLALALVVIVTLALGRPSADPAREVLVFVLVVGPFPLWLALRWLGDRGLVRGLFERPPPSVTLDEQTLELCLPSDGCRLFDLDAIAELRPRPGIRPSLLWSVPEGELIDRDGRIVARIPSSVVAPLGLPRGIETGPRVPADRAWGRPVRGHRASPLAGRDPMAGAGFLTPAPGGRSGTVPA